MTGRLGSPSPLHCWLTLLIPRGDSRAGPVACLCHSTCSSKPFHKQKWAFPCKRCITTAHGGHELRTQSVDHIDAVNRPNAFFQRDGQLHRCSNLAIAPRSFDLPQAAFRKMECDFCSLRLVLRTEHEPDGRFHYEVNAQSRGSGACSLFPAEGARVSRI